jgi:3-hydroxyisobutyrate dehydrogenase-like beta-hydroxyacid dehydrogenase
MSDEIGFIGLGNMGGRMTARLVEKGRPVIGYDVRPGLAQQLAARPAAEVQETLLQAAVYAGAPATLESFRVAEKVLKEMEQDV